MAKNLSARKSRPFSRLRKPVQPLPTYVAPRPIVRPSLPPHADIEVTLTPDTRIADIAALHAPDRNVSGEFYCTAGCKGAYPCPTMQIVERDA
jgi:hypothetical protein